MKRKYVFISSIAVGTFLLFAGGVYAWRAQSSDVSKPVPTPDTNTVRYHVLGTSMGPTINDGDWLLARTEVKTMKRGDIVIMRYPKDDTKIYCRRIVAVAGDKVVMKYFSNVKLTTVYSQEHPDGVVFPRNVAPSGNAYGEYDADVAAGELYVVGDNAVPGGSFDSDEWGMLPIGDVTGVVVKRISPNPQAF